MRGVEDVRVRGQAWGEARRSRSDRGLVGCVGLAQDGMGVRAAGASALRAGRAWARPYALELQRLKLDEAKARGSPTVVKIDLARGAMRGKPRRKGRGKR